MDDDRGGGVLTISSDNDGTNSSVRETNEGGVSFLPPKCVADRVNVRFLIRDKVIRTLLTTLAAAAL